VYVRELQVRYRRRRVRGRQSLPDALLTIQDAAAAFQRLLAEEPVEVCGVFCLSTRHHVLAYHELSRGTIDATMVSPREVFKIALLANAAAILIGHNHPSGDPTPSPADIDITSRLARASELMNISLTDHVIVAPDRYVSFKETGRL
jgi:DNA repair protein RadC